MLYKLLTGHPPFRAPTTVETLPLVVGNEVVSPRRLNPALPHDLETFPCFFHVGFGQPKAD